jgi:hypothetical protein
MRDIEDLKSIVRGELFDDFSVRVEDLYWREDSDGNLLVAESRSPEVVKQVTLGPEGLGVTDTNPRDVGWGRLTVVSEPETVMTRQQD